MRFTIPLSFLLSLSQAIFAKEAIPSTPQVQAEIPQTKTGFSGKRLAVTALGSAVGGFVLGAVGHTFATLPSNHPIYPIHSQDNARSQAQNSARFRWFALRVSNFRLRQAEILRIPESARTCDQKKELTFNFDSEDAVNAPSFTNEQKAKLRPVTGHIDKITAYDMSYIVPDDFTCLLELLMNFPKSISSDSDHFMEAAATIQRNNELPICDEIGLKNYAGIEMLKYNTHVFLPSQQVPSTGGTLLPLSNNYLFLTDKEVKKCTKACMQCIKWYVYADRLEAFKIQTSAKGFFVSSEYRCHPLEGTVNLIATIVEGFETALLELKPASMQKLASGAKKIGSCHKENNGHRCTFSVERLLLSPYGLM